MGPFAKGKKKDKSYNPRPGYTRKSGQHDKNRDNRGVKKQLMKLLLS